MKFLTPKQKVLFAETSWRGVIVPMEANANLPMGLPNSNAILNNKCLIKLGHAMLLKKRDVAHMVLVATFYTALTIHRDILAHQLSFEPSSMKLEKRKEAEF
jgi:hypothetical protein